MSEQTVLRSPQVVAKELDISPATLRRWSDEFTHHLSLGAGGGKGRHRRYTNSDIATLTVVKNLLDSGLTYEQVRQKLNGNITNQQEPEAAEAFLDDDASPVTRLEETEDFIDDEDDDGAEEDERALVAHNEESPAITFLTNTLATLSDSQKSILNSQAANRELLGVLLQDNFNLKEENNRLRERILEVERNMAKDRQEEESRREALRQELETKISAATQIATEAVATARTIETPEIRAVENKSGCLGMLLGKGGTQIVTVPRRRKGQEPPPAGRQQQPPGGPQQPPHHPKPMYPPE